MNTSMIFAPCTAVLIAVSFLALALPHTAAFGQQSDDDRFNEVLHRLDVMVCAQNLTFAMVIDVGKNMNLAPEEIARYALARPEDFKVLYRGAIRDSSRRLANILFGFLDGDGEEDKELIAICGRRNHPWNER